MAYMALYRKLRPRNFRDVAGQEAIVRTLVNQIKSDRISHAYLFCGTRGTGKTSVAKIFSRAVNCLNIQDGEPCGECQACRDILQQRSMNVIEIDAASNNGVDNIRDIREEVKYPPTEGRYKVYIIDEVHMLSTGAFNALLKTLEEPPAHIIFILATTDPQKLPATILSRCQRFDFKRIGVEEMTRIMRDYAAQESLAAEEEALQYIAEVSDGAMRDCLSLLDQSLSFYAGETVTMDKVLRLLGAADVSVLFDFTEAVYARDSTAVMDIIQGLLMDGRDAAQFAADEIQHLRNLLVAASVEKKTLALDYSSERTERYRAQGKKIGIALLISFINTFSQLQSQLRYASSPKIMLEIASLKLCGPLDGEAGLNARMDRLEQEMQSFRTNARTNVRATARVDDVQAVASSMQEAPLKAEPGPPVKKPDSELNPNPEPEPNPNPEPGLLPEAGLLPEPELLPEADLSADLDWAAFVSGFENPLRSILHACKPDPLEDGALRILCPDDPKKRFLTKRQPQLEEALERRLHRKTVLSFHLAESASAPLAEEQDWADMQDKITLKIDFDS
ncbi:MAG: DNA polymerase III subunit gamma/tau [Clostridiales bacterium]|jgi:DNA polymerase-3 subunit gamma/tau|nr:DNA polymerase III subunit gamma/tau [Clostridiales bacterium]